MYAQEQLDAVAAQHLTERLAQRRRLAGQHVPGGLGESDVAAQATHGLGHFGADGSTAEDQQAAREGLHAGYFMVGPDTL